MEVESTISAIIETLVCKGWCFRDAKEIGALIELQIVSSGDAASAERIESELLVDMDLRSIGGKWLQSDPCVLKRSSHLQGPKVLQIVSVKDISQSSIEDCNRRSDNRRLLRLVLTDGHSEITAIEYSRIPSMDDDIVPGTKLRLEYRVVMHSGILCLKPKVVTVLGGMVQELYEEWKVSKKYSGLSRSSLRSSQMNDSNGPPSFVKLKIEAISHRSNQRKSSYTSDTTSKTAAQTFINSTGISDLREAERKENLNLEAKVDDGGKAVTTTERPEEKPSSSEFRQKEVSEAVPVQNQAAAQKLLQKMNQPTQGRQPARGQRRGKGKQGEPEVFTLEEWEKRKGGVNSYKIEGSLDVSHDEEIARQLQDQLYLEDYEGESLNDSEAERIKMSMFSFGRAADRDQSTSGFRGRGRGRGPGRRRGRGNG